MFHWIGCIHSRIWISTRYSDYVHIFRFVVIDVVLKILWLSYFDVCRGCTYNRKRPFISYRVKFCHDPNLFFNHQINESCCCGFFYISRIYVCCLVFIVSLRQYWKYCFNCCFVSLLTIFRTSLVGYCIRKLMLWLK